MPRTYQIELRRGTAAEWTAANPVLADGELGYETDTGQTKVGDGVTAWNSLAYWAPGNATSVSVTANGDGTASGSTGLAGGDATYTSVAVGAHAALRAKAKASKGGVVGTGGKPVIAFRFDHQLDDLRASIWPLFVARALPASVGIVSRFPVGDTTSSGTTWADVHTLNQQGCEIWAHSATHADPAYYPGVQANGDPKLSDANTRAGIYREAVTAKAEIEAQGFKVMGFQMPGITPCDAPHWSPEKFNPNGDGWRSWAGQLLLATYPLIEVSDTPVYRSLPTDGSYALNHITADTMTEAAVKEAINAILDYGLGVEIMFHATFALDTANSGIGLTAITNVLDYVVSLRDAGLVDVLTPSALAFADPASDARMTLIPVNAGTFATVNAALTWTLNSNNTINTDGGHTGPNYLHCPKDDTYWAVWTNRYVNTMAANGETFIFEGWVRNTDASLVGTPEIFILDKDDNTRLNVTKQWTVAAQSGWTRVRFPFSVPVATTTLEFRIGRYRTVTQAAIDWDDITVRKA